MLTGNESAFQLGGEPRATCVHGLSVKQIMDLLTEAKVETASCILMHPTEDSVLSFDMVNGNKRFMFSEGRTYFAEVLKSLSLNRVIESTIIRSFFDSYTAKEALSDWNKMVRDTQTLFGKDSRTDATSASLDLYRFFTSDIKRMMKRAVEQTMYSLSTICNTAQQTLIKALHFHAVLNMVPRKPLIQEEGVKCKKQPVPIISSSSYIYEHHIAQACMEMEHCLKMTHSVQSQEDTIIVFNSATKRALAFLYQDGKLCPLELVFFGDASQEMFTRRASQPFVQTHSLCETVLPLERYLHGMETAHMKVLKELSFRSTVVIQNAEGSEGPTAKKSKMDNEERQGTLSTDPYVVQSVKEYKNEIDAYWQMVSKTLKEVAGGSTTTAHVPLWGRDVTEEEMKNAMDIDGVGNIITEDGTNIMRLVQDLQSRQGPLSGRAVDTSLAYIESGTSKLQKELVKQQRNNAALRHALTAWQKTHSVLCGRNEALMTELLTSKRSHTMQTRTLSKLQAELDAAKQDLRHVRSTMVVPEEETDSDQGKSKHDMIVNVVVDNENQNDYNADQSQQNGTRTIRYVNLSDSSDNKLRYLNANFSVPPVDQSIRESARKAWESEVRTRFFLRDYVFSPTGNHMERQPSYDTTSVYIGGFCKQFMNFRVMGRVVFDSSFTSQTDTLEHMFACESEGTAVDLVNKMQS